MALLTVLWRLTGSYLRQPPHPPPKPSGAAAAFLPGDSCVRFPPPSWWKARPPPSQERSTAAALGSGSPSKGRGSQWCPGTWTSVMGISGKIVGTEADSDTAACRSFLGFFHKKVLPGKTAYKHTHIQSLVVIGPWGGSSVAVILLEVKLTFYDELMPEVVSIHVMQLCPRCLRGIFRLIQTPQFKTLWALFTENCKWLGTPPLFETHRVVDTPSHFLALDRGEEGPFHSRKRKL